MKISYNWLGTLLGHSNTPEETAALLTGCGLEVESAEKVESVPGGLKGLVVGEVLECRRHPGADRLSLTSVNVGNGNPLSIVCGAPNVAAGQKVVVAKPGTTLYPLNGAPFEIKKSKIRGEVSEGMICAEDEIGLGESHAGIIVLPADTEVGKSAGEVFGIETDTIFEIGLTPNRGDAASHFGVARDLAAVLNTRDHVNTFHAVVPGHQEPPPAAPDVKAEVELRDPSGCPRYSGIAIHGVKVEESPAWLQNRLRSIGVRPINNIVDITNFVLHELGQPLHAFDLDRVEGRKIVVRKATEGETFTTLDGVVRKLSAEDLVICDVQKPMCIAGVLGGLESGVTTGTTSVFIESAYFDPVTIRRTAKRHGLRTDASFRFERGTDPEMTVKALIRAANLVMEIAGGKAAGEVIDQYPEKLPPYKVAFSYKNCNDLVGKELDRHVVRAILLSLGMEIDSEGTDGLLLYVPRYKHDVTREADVIEEALRIYGYDHVEPSRHLSYGIPAHIGLKEVELTEKIGNQLAAGGFTEIMTLSLDNAAHYSDHDKLVKVLNPLSSELGVMRADLVHGGLASIAHNVHRQLHDLRLYELGRVYANDGKGGYVEKKQLALFATGRVFPENPYGLNSDNGFAFLKSALQGVFTACGVAGVKTTAAEDERFAYGLGYEWKGKQLAVAGLLDRRLTEKAELAQDVFYAVTDWEALVKAASARTIVYREVPKFPAVRRDLALLLDRQVSYAEVEALAFRTEQKLLQEVRLFDIYEDARLAGKKSYAVRFTLQDPEATLTDKQIDAVMDKLVRTYKDKLGAELR